MLSILDSVQAVLIISVIFCVVITIITVIMRCSDVPFEINRWVLRCSIPIGILCLICLAFIPSQQSLIKAYLMVEGSKLATADNVEKLFTKVDEKIDKAVDLLKTK